jgi:hypothetical protein
VTTDRFVRLLLAAAALTLTGGFAFGAWHVVVGGGLHGNPRAAEFGLALSVVSGGALAFVIARLRATRPVRPSTPRVPPG